MKLIDICRSYHVFQITSNVTIIGQSLFFSYICLNKKKTSKILRDFRQIIDKLIIHRRIINKVYPFPFYRMHQQHIWTRVSADLWKLWKQRTMQSRERKLSKRLCQWVVWCQVWHWYVNKINIREVSDEWYFFFKLKSFSIFF